jgi:hypothetical protein
VPQIPQRVIEPKSEKVSENRAAPGRAGTASGQGERTRPAVTASVREQLEHDSAMNLGRERFATEPFHFESYQKSFQLHDRPARRRDGLARDAVSLQFPRGRDDGR